MKARHGSGLLYAAVLTTGLLAVKPLDGWLGRPATPPAAIRPRVAATLTPNTLTASERRQGWQLLFDGHTSSAWRSAQGS